MRVASSIALTFAGITAITPSRRKSVAATGDRRFLRTESIVSKPEEEIDAIDVVRFPVPSLPALIDTLSVDAAANCSARFNRNDIRDASPETRAI